MKKIYFLLTILLTFTIQGTSYVTYGSSGGRLGDELISYAHAKWLSYKYGLTLLYKPFKFSDSLRLHELELPFNSVSPSNYVCPKPGDNPHYQEAEDTIFDIPFFPYSLVDNIDLDPESFFRFDIDWDDPQFKALLQEAIKPNIPLILISPPADCISIALHVRKNSGGFDWPLSYETIEKLGYLPEGLYTDFLYPLKCPPDSYYIEQLKTVSAMFAHQPLYIYIFTDDPNPEKIAHNYKACLKDYKNLIFDYRKTENQHYLNVLEDLFSLTKFNVLIRSDSNFSIIASIIGNFKVVIAPSSYKRIENTITINKVFINKYDNH